MPPTLPHPPRPPQPSQLPHPQHPPLARAACLVQPPAQPAPALAPVVYDRFMTEVFAPPAACPHCGSGRFQRWGKTRAAQTQRFRCHGCGRTFTSLTGTPLAQLRHRERWPLFLACMQRSLPLRPTARVVAVDKNTAFRWRHRFCQFLLGVRTECLGPAVELISFRSHVYPKGEGNGYPASFPHRAEPPHPFRPRLEQHMAIILAAADQDGRFVAYALRPAFFGAANGQAPDPGRPLPRLELVSGAVVRHEGGLTTYAFQHLCNQRSQDAVYVRVPPRKVIPRSVAAVPHGPFCQVRQEVRSLRWWLRRFRGVSIRWLQSYLTWFMALRRAGAVSTFTTEEVAYAAAG